MSNICSKWGCRLFFFIAAEGLSPNSGETLLTIKKTEYLLYSVKLSSIAIQGSHQAVTFPDLASVKLIYYN